MAFLGIKINHDIAKLLSKIEVAGEKADTSELHITLMYFGKHWDISEIFKSLKIIQDIAPDIKPFIVKTNTVSHFPGYQKDKCAVIAKIESPELHHLRTKLAKKFDAEKIDYSKQFKEYKPHITLSYAEEEPDDLKIDSIQFTVSEITLWAGEEMNDRMMITFPLGGGAVKNGALLQKAEMFEKVAAKIL